MSFFFSMRNDKILSRLKALVEIPQSDFILFLFNIHH